MAKPMDQYTWRELEVGNVITEPGNAQEYKTGDWRSQRPVSSRRSGAVSSSQRTASSSPASATPA